ncbi:arsenate reductase (glutaredoxin) [Ectopseudomonas mendocina]|uniref:Arsenate reductase n=1 Tax=Ectopseudomonas mendocina S5.2 TaxID=1225174 RepID=A0ABM5VV07_ECTME|nr:arsenate reductase (glutaredoxin) [Pseudomonas mendocina]ALN18692.1 arsenate reductase [Pseudomonas mendocina S5.2]KES00457.1 arsenate reductase [Pseudomonas mendocina]QTN46248.1 arsenate reductase (glutaredoxin) [Pseudomonas mendocina]
MTDLTLYHNPRCSKSRGALELLEARGVQPNVVRYLETPPSASELESLLGKLGIPARDLLRSGEDEYKTLGLSDTSLSEAQLIDAMVKHPKLIERPILIAGDKAVIGRPPEKVLELLA